MILIDTSVWIDHLRAGDDNLLTLLDSSQVLAHPFVIGELACGNLRKRDDVLRLLNDLPEAPVASHEEVLHFIESNKLMGHSGLRNEESGVFGPFSHQRSRLILSPTGS